MTVPYRDRVPLGYELAARRRWWRRIHCIALYLLTVGWLGHKWRITRKNNERFAALGDLHPLAGCDALCLRCGTVWLDALPGAERHLANLALVSRYGATEQACDDHAETATTKEKP